MNGKNYLLAILLALFAVPSFLTSCGGDDDEQISPLPQELLGLWVQASRVYSNCEESGTTSLPCTDRNCTTVEFFENNTFEYIVREDGVENVTTGTVQVKGDQITLCPGGGSDCGTDTLTLGTDSFSASYEEDGCTVSDNYVREGTQTSSADVTVDATDAAPVSEFFFGQNYWSWVDEWGSQVDGTEEMVAELNIQLLRVGGTENDRNYPEAFDYAELDAAVAYADAIGAEILFQIPLLNNMNGEPMDVASALELVNYIREKGYPIRYFAIGNEPDIYTDQGVKDAYSVAELCTAFSAMSDAIREVDENYVIVGPDLAWKYFPGNNWLSPFLQSCGTSLDVITLHRYPFDPEEATKEAVMADHAEFRNNINMIKGYMNNLGMSGTPLAYTEHNVTYDGEPSNSNFSGSPGSFWAGLWVADMVGVGMEEGIWNMSFWSISEGWTLGFIDGDTHMPRAAYHVLKLLATQVGDQSLSVTNTLSDVTAYATRHSDTGDVIAWFLNKSDQEVTIAWELKEAGSVREFEDILPAESLVLVVQQGGESRTVWVYSQEQFYNNEGAVQTD